MNIRDRIGLWADEELRDIYWSDEPFKAIKEQALTLLVPHCSDKGCKNRGNPCILRGYTDEDEVMIYWYCGEHSQRHGFCYVCGEFWGGTESFDFGPGYCSNCAPELEDDYDDEWEDDWSYEP